MGEKSTGEVRTVTGASREDNIRVVFGPAVARELLKVSAEETRGAPFRMDGLITNANYSVKKGIYLFFINRKWGLFIFVFMCVVTLPLRPTCGLRVTSQST